MSSRSRLTLRDKVDIISMYNRNECTEQEIRRKYQIDRVHFYKIISRKEEYLSQYAKAPIKNSVNMEVNNRVWDWYVESKANNIALNGPMIQTQARKIAQQLGFDGFRASNGWLQCFKMRHNIRFSGPPAHKRDPQLAIPSPKEMSELLKAPYWNDDENTPEMQGFKMRHNIRLSDTPANKRDPQPKSLLKLAASPKPTPYWKEEENTSQTGARNSSTSQPNECETIEILESDCEDGYVEGADLDEDDGNDIQDEISFEDEMISESKFNPPLRADVNNSREDVCRTYQDVLDCIHRLQCFSVSRGDSKLLEMSTEMRNYVEQTIYRIDN